MKKLKLILAPCLLTAPILMTPFLTNCSNQPTTKPWYLDREYIDSLTVEDITKPGGEVRTVKVNGLDHRVRLIGIDMDTQDADGRIRNHTTWEFADLICDSNGYSLAVQWNDTETGDDAAYDFTNSLVRKALNGVGNPQQQHINWGQVSNMQYCDWSETYKDMTVLDMLPSDFVNVLKPTDKVVPIYEDNEWKEKRFQDKLFLLSNLEINNKISEEERGLPYQFYELHKIGDPVCVKNQIKTEALKPRCSNIPVGRGQLYADADLLNYAGTNYPAAVGELCCGNWWLRSPIKQVAPYQEAGWVYQVLGDQVARGDSCQRMISVAPAFCI